MVSKYTHRQTDRHLFQLKCYLYIIPFFGSPPMSNGHSPDRDDTVDVVSHPGMVLCPAWCEIFVEESREKAGHWVLGGDTAMPSSLLFTNVIC